MAQKTAESYLVTSLPDVAPEDLANLTQHAGHIALDEKGNSNLFFWMVSSNKGAAAGKTIFWLNGGPGCSSLDGFFLENGPLRFIDNKLQVNKGGWHEFANIVFLDQPAGTGLSYTTDQYAGTLPAVTTDFLSFLKEFFRIFPARVEDEIFLAGESYAGTYIPYFARGILDHNDGGGTPQLNLQGLAIGNGWIDPTNQYASFIPFAVQTELVSAATLTELEAQLEICKDYLRQSDVITLQTCEELVNIILKGSMTGPEDDAQCLNQYDTRLTDSFPACGLNWPNELPLMGTYMHRADVLEALHATSSVTPWVECSGPVGTALRFDNSLPAVTLLPDILTRIKVLLFSGQQDLICNHLGTEYLISNLTWNGALGLEGARAADWTVNDVAAGKWTSTRNLEYVLVFNSSHMVPYDVPEVALDMMNRFMGIDPSMHGYNSKIEFLDEPPVTATPPPSTPESDKNQAAPPAKEGSEANNETAGAGSDSSTWEDYYSVNGAAVLMVLVMAVCAGLYLMKRSRNRTKKPTTGGDAQWFPLSTSGNTPNRQSSTGVSTRARRDYDEEAANELDELVVESGIILGSEDEDEDDEDGGIRRPNTRLDASNLR